MMQAGYFTNEMELDLHQSPQSQMFTEKKNYVDMGMKQTKQNIQRNFCAHACGSTI